MQTAIESVLVATLVALVGGVLTMLFTQGSDLGAKIEAQGKDLGAKIDITEQHVMAVLAGVKAPSR